MQPPSSLTIGQHLIAELVDLPAARLRDLDAGQAALRAALEAEGYRILRESGHSFETGGGGFTCLFLLAESHASLHSYPEFSYLAFDLFSCGKREPRRVLERLASALNATLGELRIVPRRIPAAQADSGA